LLVCGQRRYRSGFAFFFTQVSLIGGPDSVMVISWHPWRIQEKGRMGKRKNVICDQHGETIAQTLAHTNKI
jgi:hypothetical protein